MIKSTTEGNLYLNNTMICVHYVVGYHLEAKNILKVYFKTGNYLEMPMKTEEFKLFDQVFQYRMQQCRQSKDLIKSNHELRTELNSLKQILDTYRQNARTSND